MKRLLISHSVIGLSVLALLGGCSALEEDKINYKGAVKGTTLDVPPDLTQLRRDSRYALESTSATASGFANARQAVKDAGTAANVMGDVRMERSGEQRWLVVNQSADKVWDTLREFWTSNGFALATDAADLGIMETEWTENRAKIPQDLIRRTLGKVLDGLYSTGERDRYRTRVERNSSGGVDIFISHRGMVEDYADVQKTRTIWKPRPSDPELEIEFLRRLMIQLGAPKDKVGTLTAAPSSAATTATQAASADVVTVEGQPMLKVQDTLDRAWRRAGLALDRSGFTVEDRDRNKGIYYVRYVAPSTDKEEPGFFARLFSSSKAATPSLSRYQIQLQSGTGDTTQIRVLTQEGRPETSDSARKILQLLAVELR